MQLANGLGLNSSRNPGLISNQGGLVIGFFAFAIARAWALVGARDSHLLSAVAGMVRQPGTRHNPDPYAGRSSRKPE